MIFRVTGRKGVCGKPRRGFLHHSDHSYAEFILHSLAAAGGMKAVYEAE